MLAIPVPKSSVNATNTCGCANYGNNTEVILAIPAPESPVNQTVQPMKLPRLPMTWPRLLRVTW